MDTPAPALPLPPLPVGRLDRAAIRARLRLIDDLRREQRRAETAG